MPDRCIPECGKDFKNCVGEELIGKIMRLYGIVTNEDLERFKETLIGCVNREELLQKMKSGRGTKRLNSKMLDETGASVTPSPNDTPSLPVDYIEDED